MTEFTVPSANGRDTLHGVMVAPDGEPRGMIQFVHGMAEYIERYLPTMQFLADRGFLCFGHDHIGHGKSQPRAELHGHIDYRGGGETLVQDVLAVRAHMAAQYPSLPCILFGHSMGSFVVRCAVTEAPDAYAALIACGTGGPQAAIGLGKGLTALLKRIKGEAAQTRLLYALMFGAYNKRFCEPSVFAWLSRDTENVRRYESDPHCGFSFTIGGIHALLTVNARANSARCCQETPDLPILLISGAEDPVGDYGEGVRRVYNLYKDAKKSDVTLKLFEDDRHEILNETDSTTVLRYLGDWIDRRFGAA